MQIRGHLPGSLSQGPRRYHAPLSASADRAYPLWVSVDGIGNYLQPCESKCFARSARLEMCLSLCIVCQCTGVLLGLSPAGSIFGPNFSAVTPSSPWRITGAENIIHAMYHSALYFSSPAVNEEQSLGLEKLKSMFGRTRTLRNFTDHILQTNLLKDLVVTLQPQVS